MRKEKLLSSQELYDKLLYLVHFPENLNVKLHCPSSLCFHFEYINFEPVSVSSSALFCGAQSLSACWVSCAHRLNRELGALTDFSSFFASLNCRCPANLQ